MLKMTILIRVFLWNLAVISLPVGISKFIKKNDSTCLETLTRNLEEPKSLLRGLRYM